MWGRRPPAARPTNIHPFGYGREVYFWSFVVAVLVFALGAGVSIYEGIIHIAHPEPAVSPIIAYVVLLVAFLLEGWSTLEAFKEFKEAKGELGWIEAMPPVEGPAGVHRPAGKWRGDGRHHRRRGRAALSQLTGDPFFDGAASVVIGVILGCHRAAPGAKNPRDY